MTLCPTHSFVSPYSPCGWLSVIPLKRGDGDTNTLGESEQKYGNNSF